MESVLLSGYKLLKDLRWGKPVHIACPACHKPLRIKKTIGLFYYKISCKCCGKIKHLSIQKNRQLGATFQEDSVAFDNLAQNLRDFLYGRLQS